MKALTVDDHPLTRNGLGNLLKATFEHCEVWGTSRTAEALDLADRLTPDLVLLDLHLPDPPSTPVTVRTMRERGVVSPIVILTAFEGDPLLADCLEAGADGCLIKDSAPPLLAALLRRAVDGERVIDPRVKERLDALATAPGPFPRPTLTARELEIVGLLAEGLSNRAVGQRLFLAESTVKWHVRRLLEKLSVESRWQAVVRAQELHLI